MKLKKYAFFFLFLSLCFMANSQEKEESSTKEKSEFWKKVRIGGGMGLDFSNNGTSVSISPSAIYQVNPKFSTGAGINFGYNSFKTKIRNIDNTTETINTKQFNYGVSLISLYNPFDGLQLSGEFEHNFVNESIKQSGQTVTRDFSFPSLYIGAGYNIGYFSAGLRYNLLYNEDKSIYNSALVPFVRVYF